MQISVKCLSEVKVKDAKGLGFEMRKVIEHHFPDFYQILSEVEDPGKNTYTASMR